MVYMEENLVLDEGTENVETTTTEETVGEVEQITPPEKTYTQEELDSIVGRRLARQEARIRKDYDRKYGSLENTLKAGTGKESVEEVTDTFVDFYRKKGIEMPKKPVYSDKDTVKLVHFEGDETMIGKYVSVKIDRAGVYELYADKI